MIHGMSHEEIDVDNIFNRRPNNIQIAAAEEFCGKDWKRFGSAFVGWSTMESPNPFSVMCVAVSEDGRSARAILDLNDLNPDEDPIYFIEQPKEDQD